MRESGDRAVQYESGEKEKPFSLLVCRQHLAQEMNKSPD